MFLNGFNHGNIAFGHCYIDFGKWVERRGFQHHGEVMQEKVFPRLNVSLTVSVKSSLPNLKSYLDW